MFSSDTGANIGLYSLIAARMGHEVVAVEPYKQNLHHFHKAVQLGKVPVGTVVHTKENPVNDACFTL